MSGRRPAGEPWGWHRLTPEWADRFVRTAGISPGELVLDLGAGTGVLTEALLAAGAQVIAVELHPGRSERLRHRFAGTGVRVLCADMLDVGWPRRPFRVVANPPFAGSTELLHRLTARGSRLRQADLILQRALVRRWVTGPEAVSEVSRRNRSGPDGRRAAGFRHFQATSPLSLPRRAFVPRPRVDTAVLRLTRVR